MIARPWQMPSPSRGGWPERSAGPVGGRAGEVVGSAVCTPPDPSPQGGGESGGALARFRDHLRRADDRSASACRSCAHFDGDPAAIEAAFPNLAAMSSGYAAVRASDGLCRLRGIYLSGGGTCAHHLPWPHPQADAALAGPGASAI